MAAQPRLAHRATLGPRVGGERHRTGPVDEAGAGDGPAPVVRRDQVQRARVEQRFHPHDRVPRQGGHVDARESLTVRP